MADVSKFLRKINSGFQSNIEGGFDTIESLVIVSKSNPLVMLSGDLKYKLGFNFNSNGKGIHSSRFKSLVSLEFEFDRDKKSPVSKICFQYDLEDGASLMFEGSPLDAAIVLKKSLSNFSEVSSDLESVYLDIDQFNVDTGLFDSISQFCTSVELMMSKQFS